jgi:hypothetical protein
MIKVYDDFRFPRNKGLSDTSMHICRLKFLGQQLSMCFWARVMDIEKYL